MTRSLSRGLAILTMLNRRDSATVGEIAKELAIPRATVYRVLGTLCEKGLVRQHESDQRFRITPKVRTLSDGFTDEDHIDHISRRYLKRVTAKLQWPVALATISGVDLIVRDNTDQMSPLAIETFSRGYRLPILHSASGICILAYSKPARRRVILDTLEETDRNEDRVSHQRDSIERKMREVRRRGYAVHHRRRKYSDLTAIAVPIIPAQDRVRGAVTIRYARTAMKLPAAISAFIPVLTEAADGMASRIKLHFDKLEQ